LQSEIEIYTDGASRLNPGPSASGYMVYQDRKVIREHSSYNGVATNNYAEYRAIIMALEWCRDSLKGAAPAGIRIYSDSKLIINQINGKYKINSFTLLKMNDEVKSLIRYFGKLEFVHTNRENTGIVLVDKQLNALLDRMEKMGVQERYKLDNGQSIIKVD
jgi:ribonuclease HI